MKIDIHQQLFISRRQLASFGLVPKGKRFSIKLASMVLNRPWLWSSHRRTRARVVRPPYYATIVDLPGRLNIWGKQRELPSPPKKTFRELNSRTNVV